MTEVDNIKLYDAMTTEEQLKWVTQLTEFATEKLPVLERLGDAWEQTHRKDMAVGLRLLGAFQFARDYVQRGLHYGDFAARVKRFRMYLDKIKQELSAGLAVTGADGHVYALVRPSVPLRRRGRPTKEEAAARLRGETYLPDDKERQKQEKIAELIGLPVVISKEAPRELNNAELAEIRAKKQAEYDRQNPSLFGNADGATGVAGGGEAAVTVGPDPSVLSPMAQRGLTPSVTVAPKGETSAAGGSAPKADATQMGTGTAVPSGIAQTEPVPTVSPMMPYYGDEDLVTLKQKCWLMPPELQEQVGRIQGLRAEASSKAEFAKALALQGADAKTIEPYATEAQECTEAYRAIYAQVDETLAIVRYRLLNDEEYLKKFRARFDTPLRPVDVPAVVKMLRRHWEKMRDEGREEELTLRIKALIEQESPEYAAKVKAEQERKEEIAAILKYLKRTDKLSTYVRMNSAKEKFARLQALMGEQEAQPYYVFVQKIIDDYEANVKSKDEAETAEGKDTDPTPDPIPADAPTRSLSPTGAGNGSATDKPKAKSVKSVKSDAKKKASKPDSTKASKESSKTPSKQGKKDASKETFKQPSKPDED